MFHFSKLCDGVTRFDIIYCYHYDQNVQFLSKNYDPFFLVFSITVKSRLLTRLVYKHMQTFSDCLWRGFLALMYCVAFWQKVEILFEVFGNSDHGVMYVPGGAGTGGGTGGPPGLPSAPRTEVGPLNGLRSPCGCGMTVEVKLGPGSLPLFCKLDSGKSCSCDEVSCKFNKK